MTLDSLSELGQTVYYGNTVLAWAQAIVTFALWFTVLPVARGFVARRVAKRAADYPVTTLLMLRSLIDATTRLFMVAVATYLGMTWLRIPPRADRYVDTAILVVLWLQVALWLTAAVRHAVETRRRNHEAADSAASLNILRFVGVLAVWVVAFLMLLTNLGIEIAPLIAGLGIGGVAIALAVQNVLGDLFASLSIALDKPFRIGDFLVVGDEKGTVEQIGIKSTRLRSLSGEQIVMSNGDLLKSRVRNYGLLYERRAAFTVSIVYETPVEAVREVPRIIEAAIRAQGKTRFDRSHFASFGEYALNFEAVYFVLSAEYNDYMDIQQAINIRLMEEFAERGIEFAYPTTKQFTVTEEAAPPA
ncbi:MAG TPA: mechanosensitive ion channel family protein [Steroidobacteraceae bacterium]|nr:mechanosensitive ion channel family protein [Steroidobacteraceae bacterium]